MKPGIPWSVKGIEPEVREAAKHAARRAGMTLGEWLNGVILDQNEHILGASQVENAKLREYFVPSSNENPPLNRDAAPRPAKPRAAAQERKDDNALRLHEIAQQLSDLAQKERQSAAIKPYEQARREDDQEAMARILDRIDDNERQTVEAFTAVNDRLSLLSQQINALNRSAFPERPEDVPGYAALETAIRNVVAHIEVSERRSREQFSALQDRLSTLADRALTPPPLNGEEVLRAVPVLSGLDVRLAEIVNRVQHSEGSLAERLDSVRAMAGHAASQAQSSALTAARGEMRDLESRLMHAIGEATSAATVSQQPALDEIASLRADVAGLARRFEELRPAPGGERDIQALQVALEQLSTRVAQGADMRSLSETDKRLAEVSRRLEEVALATRARPQNGHLEERIAELEARMSEALMRQGDGRAMQRLEESIADVSQRMAQAEAQFANLQTMERAIRQLQDSLQQSHESVSLMAEQSANRALERLMPQQAAGSQELRALQEGLRAVRESASLSERRNQDTLEAVHETLAQIVAKISDLERKPQSASEEAVADMPGGLSATTDVYAGSAPSASHAIEDAEPSHPPLTAGDDFIAAARRAAQAAANRPSALRAEYAVQTQQAPEKRSFLASLRRRKAKPVDAGPEALPQFESATSAEKDAKARSGSRKRLIFAGIVLLMAASFLAYNHYVKPRLPAGEPAPVELPATPPAAGKTGLLKAPADRIVTGSLAKVMTADPASVTAVQGAEPEMPPAQLGSQSLREAAAQGDPKAQFIIASRYLEGEAVAQDLSKAAYWYGLAAGQGLAPAQYRLATLYELGRGVPKNLTEAQSWYQRAAMRGNVKAMHNAAVIAAGTDAGPADYDKAFRWFKAAAELGFKDSQFNTAILYERGLGTKANPAEAYFWYSLAARQGEADAKLRASTLGAELAADQLTAIDSLLKSWKPKPFDESANTVAITKPDWNGPDTGNTVTQSSLTSAWKKPRV